MLFALPAVRFRMEVAPGLAGRVPLLLQSLTSLCVVLTLYQKTKLGANVAGELRAALRNHGVRKLNAYTGMDGVFVPKDHYALHIPAQVERDGELMDTLVAGRYHQIAKLAVESIDHTKTVEATVLGRSVMLHLNTVATNKHAFTSALLGDQVDVSEDVGEGVAASATKELSLDGTKIGHDDIIRVDGAMVIVDLCLCIDLDFHVIARRLLPAET